MILIWRWNIKGWQEAASPPLLPFTPVSLQVVIIDEAHNLSDTLSCIHSTELTGAQVRIHGTRTPPPRVKRRPPLT